MIPRSRLGLNCLTRDPSGVLARDARCRLLICKSLRIAEVSRDGAGLPYEDSMQYGVSVLRLSRKPAGSIGLRGGSYCRRSGSVSGWMVAAVCRRLLLTNRKWQLYHTWDDPGCRLQGTRTILPGKTPSKTTGNAGDEPRVNMDDAGKSSTPSIPGPDCTPRQSSGYGRCLREAGDELYQKSWTKRDEKGEQLECAAAGELDRGHRTGLTHAENGRLHGVSQRTSTYAQGWCKKMQGGRIANPSERRWIA